MILVAVLIKKAQLFALTGLFLTTLIGVIPVIKSLIAAFSPFGNKMIQGGTVPLNRCTE